jgi:hypothetical protein
MRHTPNKTLTQLIPCPMFPFLVPLTVRAPVIDPGNIKIYLLTEEIPSVFVLTCHRDI